MKQNTLARVVFHAAYGLLLLLALFWGLMR